jgi:hypothetical protein
MTAESIFVRTAAIAVRTGRLLMNRWHKPDKSLFSEGNEGNEGEGGQAVVEAWLKRHPFVSFCEKASSPVRIRSGDPRASI